jgi:hypothetical protein
MTRLETRVHLERLEKQPMTNAERFITSKQVRRLANLLTLEAAHAQNHFIPELLRKGFFRHIPMYSTYIDYPSISQSIM